MATLTEGVKTEKKLDKATEWLIFKNQNEAEQLEARCEVDSSVEAHGKYTRLCSELSRTTPRTPAQEEQMEMYKAIYEMQAKIYHKQTDVLNRARQGYHDGCRKIFGSHDLVLIGTTRTRKCSRCDYVV